jgi:hypothetical protein
MKREGRSLGKLQESDLNEVRTYMGMLEDCKKVSTDPETGKVKWWETDEDPKTKFKEVCEISRAFLGGKKPSKLSAEEFSELVGLLDEDNNPKAKAAVNLIIASRREREFLDKMVELATDEHELVNSTALLALYNFRDLESIKGMLSIIGKRQNNDNTMIIMLTRIKNSNLELMIDAVDSLLNEEWFVNEKDENSDVFKRISFTINVILQSDNFIRSRGLWWLGSDFGSTAPPRSGLRTFGNNAPYTFMNPVFGAGLGDTPIPTELPEWMKGDSKTLKRISRRNREMMLSEETRKLFEEKAGKKIKDMSDEEFQKIAVKLLTGDNNG